MPEYEGDAASPATLRMDRGPLTLAVAYPTPDSVAIMRSWRPGEPARCPLCPRAECTADANDYCLVVAPERVADGDCPLFSLVAWRAQRLAGGGVPRAGRASP
jgi:hypothetical protein